MPRRKISQPASAGFLLSLLFDLEDGGDMLLRNAGLSANFTNTGSMTLSDCCSGSRSSKHNRIKH
jgi:hypothetical protein